jgi:hypothetical protein
MLGILAYELLEILYYSGVLVGKGLYAIYGLIYGAAPDPSDANDAEKLARLEKRILELERKLDGGDSSAKDDAP